MRKAALVLAIVFTLPAWSQKVELSGTGYRSRSSSSHQKVSQDAYSMRSLRRVGLGMTAAGDAGFLGANLELNFSPRWSFVTGVGGAQKFNSYSLSVRRFFAGKNFLPYVSAGLSRWSGQSGSSIESTNPGFLADSLMSESDKKKGRINELLLTSKLGMQYMTLEGPYAGYALQFDVQVLLDPIDLVLVATGGIGASYYF